jgi:hypothetical protein
MYLTSFRKIVNFAFIRPEFRYIFLLYSFFAPQAIFLHKIGHIFSNSTLRGITKTWFFRISKISKYFFQSKEEKIVILNSQTAFVALISKTWFFWYVGKKSQNQVLKPPLQTVDSINFLVKMTFFRPFFYHILTLNGS